MGDVFLERIPDRLRCPAPKTFPQLVRIVRILRAFLDLVREFAHDLLDNLQRGGMHQLPYAMGSVCERNPTPPEFQGLHGRVDVRIGSRLHPRHKRVAARAFPLHTSDEARQFTARALVPERGVVTHDLKCRRDQLVAYAEVPYALVAELIIGSEHAACEPEYGEHRLHRLHRRAIG